MTIGVSDTAAALSAHAGTGSVGLAAVGTQGTQYAQVGTTPGRCCTDPQREHVGVGVVLDHKARRMAAVDVERHVGPALHFDRNRAAQRDVGDLADAARSMTVARSRADAGADLFEQEIVRVTKAAVAAGREVREHAVDLVDRRA